MAFRLLLMMEIIIIIAIIISQRLCALSVERVEESNRKIVFCFFGVARDLLCQSFLSVWCGFIRGHFVLCFQFNAIIVSQFQFKHHAVFHAFYLYKTTKLGLCIALLLLLWTCVCVLCCAVSSHSFYLPSAFRF